MSCKAVSNRAVATMFSLYVMLLLFSERLYLNLACMLCKMLFFGFGPKLPQINHCTRWIPRGVVFKRETHVI